MPKFIDTRGRWTLGLGICDRCRRKRPLADLGQDPDTGLRVCDDSDCADQPDPYRLPQRPPDRVALPFYRPETSLALPGSGEAPKLHVEGEDD